jgi:hypothetical protein
MVKFTDGEGGARVGKRPQWVSFIGVMVLGCFALGGVVWKVVRGVGGGGVARAEAIPDDEARLRKLITDKKASNDAKAERLRQQDLGEGVQIDSSGRLIGVSADATGLPKNRSLEEAAGAKRRDDLSRITSAIGNAPDGAGDEESSGGRRGRSAVPRPHPEGDDIGRREGERGEGPPPSMEKETRLGYSVNQSASWALRRPASTSGGENARRSVGGGDEMAKALDGAVKAQEQLLAKAAARAGEAGLGGLGGQVAGPAAGLAAAGEGLYAGGDAGPAVRGPQSFGRAEIGDMRLSVGAISPYVVRQGKFLDCALVNQVRADLVESEVVAMVVRDFLSPDGNVLVPAGSTLIGAAGRVQNAQQARVYIRFDRLIYPDRRSVWFPRRVTGVDALGAAGVQGEVDRHFFLQFGSAVMLGVLDGLAAAVQGSSAGGANPSVRDLMVGRTSSNLSVVLAGILNRYGNVVPTITVEPGEKMKVFFADDVELTPYREAEAPTLEEREGLERLDAQESKRGYVPKGLQR